MTAPITPDPQHAEHASKLHSIFAALDGLIHLASNPAVMALLPPKYQGYALAAAAIDQAVNPTVTP